MCVREFHSCFPTFPQVANTPTFKYEIDAKADAVIDFKTPSPSFFITTLDQGLASEDTDQTISVNVAIVSDNESKSILNDTKEDEIWCYVFWPRLLSESFTMSVTTLQEPGCTGCERGRTLLGARNPRGKLQDREETSTMRVAPELQQLLAAK
ncbi:hypothetical protein COCVIDRAFT_43122 [Bipolaris victoriae FI3]|uniref:Uncharacterized protein n=1 Tax=Bipolaris victoriae (strain FI3) TaxID=930091 RepID=W7DR55_BIPV3|nr:hypothetical protein COCVIDRAFT_43122 [Bipolaris victoriae FI3]